MAFILPAGQEPESKLGQFLKGISGELDDLPELLNSFFEKRAIDKEKTQLEADLEELGDDASVLKRKLRIQQAKIGEVEKKRLLEVEDLKGLEALSNLKGDISEQDVLKYAGSPQTANLLMSIRNQQIAQEKQKTLDEAKTIEEKEKTKEQRGKDKNTFLKGLPADLKNAMGTEAYELLKPDQRIGIMDDGSNFFDQTGGDPVEARRLTIEKALAKEPDEFDEGTEEPKEEKVSPFVRGSESSILSRTKALVSGEPLSEYEKRIALPKDASVLDRVLYGLGKFSVDFPFYFAGGAAGGQAGAVVGGLVTAPTFMLVPFGMTAGSIVGAHAGAFAVPAMVERGLTLYQDYLEKGGEGSFGDFIKAGAETLQAGIDSGVEGAMFGILSKIMPILGKYSPFKKLFDMKGVKGKAAQEIVRSATQTGGIIGSRIVSGQKVSGDDAADLFAQAFGFNIMGRLNPKLKNIIGEKIEKSRANPEDFVQNVKQRLVSQNQDPKNPSLLTRAINDVSKEYSKAGDVFEKTEKARVGKEQLEETRAEKKELAKQIRKEPIEKILEPEKLSKKVIEAQKEVDATETKIEQQNKNIESLERNIEKAKPSDQKTRERAVGLAKEEIGRLEKQAVTQKAVLKSREKPKTIPQTQVELATAIEKHNKQLVEISKDPLGTLADSWKKMFSEDQKYQNRLEEALKRGELPEPKHLDSHIRPLLPYLKSYKELLKNVQRQIKELQNAKGTESAKSRKELGALEKNLNTNIRINEAKQKLHKRKLYVRQLARGKGRAYLKQLVKNLGTTAKEFKKDFIKTKELLDSSTAKTVKVSQKALKKSIEQVSKNPTKQNIEKLSIDSGLSKEEITEVNKKGQELAKEAKQSIEKGEPFDKFLKKIKDILEEFKEENIPTIKKAAKGALFFGGIQYGIEKAFGYKPSYSFLTLFTSGDLKTRLGATGIAALGKFIWGKAEEGYWRRKISNSTSIRETTEIVGNLRKKGWSTARLKTLRK